MRIAIVFDMEGTSHITDLREPFPNYREYWETGRGKLTDDIVAAAKGLLAGGATEVWVYNHHGAGEAEWPNVIVERLPDRTWLVEDWNKLEMRDHVDAMFQVGAHARGGSQSFLSHTILPGLRLRVDGELLSESHWWAWTGNVPLLGIVGSEALGATRGTLGEVPFLAVQRSRDRRHAEPVFHSPRDTASAIEGFAAMAVRDGAARRIATPVGPIHLEASIQNGDHAAEAMAEAGWTRTGRTTFGFQAASWRSNGEPINAAIGCAIDGAWVPYSFLFDGLDPTSPETALAYPADQAAHDDAFLHSWAADPTPEWFEPSAADGPWEGFA
jgi:D-aminopeptidase